MPALWASTNWEMIQINLTIKRHSLENSEGKDWIPEPGPHFIRRQARNGLQEPTHGVLENGKP
jgi:hypothetical protein